MPPDAHSAETIAKALVELVVKPRNEVVLGGGTRLLDVTFAVARTRRDEQEHVTV